MAVTIERSMNAELLEGSVDGTYKRIIPDRSLYQDPDRHIRERDRMENMRWPYGMFESSEKRSPDGRLVQP